MENEKWGQKRNARPTGGPLWWAIINFALAISYYSSVQAQTPTRAQLVGTWIGVHSEWDLDMFCPLPTYIRLDADSTYTLGMVDNSARPIVSTWSVSDRVVRLDTNQYHPALITLRANQLRIGTFYPMVFRRLTAALLDSAIVHKQLTGRVWQSDSLTVSLYADSRVCLENRTTKQRSVHFWQLSRLDKSVFLVISGNKADRNGGYKPLWQVVGASPKQIQLTGWYGRSITTETFRLVRILTPNESYQATDFQPCDNCFTRMWYDVAVDHTDRYKLTQLFGIHYQPVRQPGQSGLVRIRFAINCQGERGLFEVAGFNEEYQPVNFAPQITDQLVKICREHVPADLSIYVTDLPDHQPQDKAVSLTFRLKDGQLTGILP